MLDSIMKKYMTTLFSAICLIITSCTNSNSSSSSAISDSVSTVADVAADTVVAPPIIIEKLPIDTVALKSAKTSEEVLYLMKNSIDSAAYFAGILPQMAVDNLDYTKRLLKNTFDYFIVVDKPSMFVVLFDKYGCEVKAYKMACSRYFGTKHRRRDNRTPEGFFTAEGIYNSTDWLYTNDDGYTSPIRGQFGPRFIRLKTPVTSQVGIHGTGSPWSLGRRVSHGCIRLQNENILDLVKYAKPGMPIIVNPSEYDQKVNKEEGYTIPSINIGKPTQIMTPPAVLHKKTADSTGTTAADTFSSVMPDSIVGIPSVKTDTITPIVKGTVSAEPIVGTAPEVKPDTVSASI